MQPTCFEAINTFLRANTHIDLFNLYSPDMECQVNVAQDNGDRIEGDYQGKEWHGWTDGLTTWKPFRIPYKANTAPEYTDKEMRFDLAEHAEGIGLTGWNWKQQTSMWVAFDFDAILGHSDKHPSKLNQQELKEVENVACDLDWVTVRRSTSGQGLHLYVFLNNIPTANHMEHAALARFIIGKMSALTRFDFRSKVDICGGNMWVWHRKMTGTTGLMLLKQGSVLEDIQDHWRNHIPVISGKNAKQDIPESNSEAFDNLSSQHPTIKLDEDHQTLITYLKDNKACWWWDQDHHMLVTHTIHLLEAHLELEYRGVFSTISEGKERGVDQNCFLFPMRRGSWSVRRFTPGVTETDTWEQDGSGWTRCFFNRDPDFSTICKYKGGIENPKGGFVFTEAEIAEEAANYLGVSLHIGSQLQQRKTILKKHKDGRLIAEVDRGTLDTPNMMPGWLLEPKFWTRVFTMNSSTSEIDIVNTADEIIRHIISENLQDFGWMLRATSGEWQVEPLIHIKASLSASNFPTKEITRIIGLAVLESWTKVNRPFENEYPGGRVWNHNSAQIRFTTTADTDNLKFPTWLRILEHCGESLDKSVSKNKWCASNAILKGSDYLKCWIASLFQEPLEPLPYLFFYGPQESGKSMFHEALTILLTRGVIRADHSLISQAGFNAELDGAILCIVEEVDLGRNSAAYNRIKDWVTSENLSIHIKGKTPFQTKNTTHWIQCANDLKFCPVFPGDTRIIVIYVDKLQEIIPKKEIMPKLTKEAPDFIASILQLEIPLSMTRLNLPIIDTEEKNRAAQENQTYLQTFIEEECTLLPGGLIKFSRFYEAFAAWLPRREEEKWSKIRIGRELPSTIIKARHSSDAQWYCANVCLASDIPEETPDYVWISENGYLKRNQI